MSALLLLCLGPWPCCSLRTPGKQVSFFSGPLLASLLISFPFPSLSPHVIICPNGLQQVYFFSAWYCTWDALGTQIFEGSLNEWSPSLVTKSKLALLAIWQTNESERKGVEARNTSLFGKPDLEDGRLISQNNHVVGVWFPGSLMDHKWGEVRKQGKKAFSIASIF